MFIPLPENRVAGAQAALALEDTPPVLNAPAVLTLDEPQQLEYRGRTYTVPPVPYRDGIRLGKIEREFKRMAKDPDATDADALALMDEAVTLFATLIEQPPVAPRRWYLRWLKEPVPENPFRDASDAEVGELLFFFSASRMSTTVRFPSQSRATSGARRT